MEIEYHIYLDEQVTVTEPSTIISIEPSEEITNNLNQTRTMEKELILVVGVIFGVALVLIAAYLLSL